MFVGDRIVKKVIHRGNKLLGLALAWAIISHILGVAVTSLVVTFFGISPTDNFLELLGLTVWYVGLIVGIVTLLPMAVAILYYWKQLEKIKINSLAHFNTGRD
jgi:integral membrane sensor domain MASE1